MEVLDGTPDTEYSSRSTRPCLGGHLTVSEVLELKLELIQTHMIQKPMLRVEGECAVGVRVRSANGTFINYTPLNLQPVSTGRRQARARLK